MRFLTGLFIVEGFLLVFVWLMARLGDYRVRRHRVRCPLDGVDAHVEVAEQAGVAPSARDILSCSLLDRNASRSCDRQCVTRLPNRMVTTKAAR
jgi:hypothetical protein